MEIQGQLFMTRAIVKEAACLGGVSGEDNGSRRATDTDAPPALPAAAVSKALRKLDKAVSKVMREPEEVAAAVDKDA